MATDASLDGVEKVGSRVDEFAYAGRLGYPLKINPRIGSNGLENPKDFFADLFGSRSRPQSRRNTKTSDILSSDQFSDQDVSVPRFDLGWDTTPVRPALPPSRSSLPHPKISTPTRDLSGIGPAEFFEAVGGGILPPPSPIGGSAGGSSGSGGSGGHVESKTEHSTLRDSVQYSRALNATRVSGTSPNIPSFRIFASDSEGVENTAQPVSSPSGNEESLGVYRPSKRKARDMAAAPEYANEAELAPNYPDDYDDDGYQNEYSDDHGPNLDATIRDPSPIYTRQSSSSESEEDVQITSRVSHAYETIGQPATDESESEASDYNSDASVMDMISENERYPVESQDFEPTLTSDDSDVYEEWDTGNMDDEATFVVPEVDISTSLDSNGLRRSRRRRIEPVRYWLGEKPVYKLSSGTFLPTLKEVVRVSAPELNAAATRKPRKHQRLDDLADKSAVVAQVFDTEKMSFEFREVAKKLDWKNMQPAKGNPRVKVQVLFPHFDSLPISIEGLCFERGARIPEQNTGSYAYVVSVLTGHFQFQLHQEVIELRRGASLGVQRGNDFGVQNVGYTQGTLFMIKIHADMFERGLMNEESIGHFSQNVSRSVAQSDELGI